nr:MULTISPECIES: hypothetical protein [Vibrio]
MITVLCGELVVALAAP